MTQKHKYNGRQLYSEIDNRQWRHVGNGTHKRVGKDGDLSKKEYDVKSCHPTKPGKVIYWLFLALGIVAALIVIL